MDLRPYQREAVDFMGRVSRGIYADPPGTGKTPTTLAWLCEEGANNVLIVAPKIMLPHWTKEARLWYPELEIITATGSASKRAAARDVARARRSSGAAGPAAVLCNYDVLRADWSELTGFDHVVFDEAHRMKNRTAQVTKAAAKMVGKSADLALLTGTPFVNGAHEVWSLLRFCRPSEYRSFWAWAERYFDISETSYGGRIYRPVRVVGAIKGDEELARLRAELRPLMIRRPLDELLDLPEVTHIPVPVTLTPKERKVYKQMSEHHWLSHEDTVVVAVNDVSKQLRQRQLASDWGGLLDGEELGSKSKAAVALAADLEGEQVVILTAFKATAARLAEALGCPAWTGDTPDDVRTRILSRFRAGDLKMFVGTIGVIGEGVDGLQVAHTMIRLDRDWSEARNEQVVGRLRRSGQRWPVFVYELYAEDTIDADVARTCIRKSEESEAVLGPEPKGTPCPT